MNEYSLEHPRMTEKFYPKLFSYSGMFQRIFIYFQYKNILRTIKTYPALCRLLYWGSAVARSGDGTICVQQWVSPII